MPDLKAKPFFLDEEQEEWVRSTCSQMTLDEKLGQLFCPLLTVFDEETVRHLTKDLKVGSIMPGTMSAANAQREIRMLQDSSDLPLLIAANLESGGNGAVMEGTSFGMPMGCTATGNVENGYRLGKVACREGAAAGVNWAFAPVVDIDRNFHNPITNIRSFGSDPDQVTAMAGGYLRAAREENVAATIKHFPGDGCDERDQHLLVSVNDRSAGEWMSTYGRIYQTLIDQGVPAVMVGHIAQPQVARMVNPDISEEEAYFPASQSQELMTGILRERLGFNGVVITDSTLMVGYMQKLPRRLSIPRSVENGADVILFNRNVDEDFEYLKQGVEKGLVSRKRIEEAVLRVLALKASLNLHKKKASGEIVPGTDLMKVISREDTKAWTRECADQAVTLVKDPRHLLPLSPEKTGRIYLNVIENTVSDQSPFAREIRRRLEREGFAVTLRKREIPEVKSPDEVWEILRKLSVRTDEFVSRYDCCMIVLNMETVSNSTVVRVNWKIQFGMGDDIPWYAGEMPLIVVSTANPYHLLDIPMADVYVNAYTGSPAVLDAVFDKLMGRSEFKGISPVDPFCGHEDCRL